MHSAQFGIENKQSGGYDSAFLAVKPNHNCFQCT